MQMASGLTLVAWWQSIPTHTGTENLQIILRWVHFLAGITWIGLLYFFNLVNVPFMKTVTDAEVKKNVFRNLTLPALFWFRWGAVVTVFAGFWYWAQTIVAVDARNGGGNPGAAIGWWALIWIAVWAIEFGILSQVPGVAALNNGWVYTAIVAVLLAAASYCFVSVNGHGWESNRMIAIGLGGGMGLVMLLNVWGIIWRNNKKVINGTLAGTPPADGPKLARQAFLASRTNAWLSIPMLFFMAAASHYVIFGGK